MSLTTGATIGIIIGVLLAIAGIILLILWQLGILWAKEEDKGDDLTDPNPELSQEIINASTQSFTDVSQLLGATIQSPHEVLAECSSWVCSLGDRQLACQEVFKADPEVETRCSVYDESNWRCGIHEIEMIESINANLTQEEVSAELIQRQPELRVAIVKDLTTKTNIEDIEENFTAEINALIETGAEAIAASENGWAVIKQDAQSIRTPDGKFIQAISQDQYRSHLDSILVNDEPFRQAVYRLSAALNDALH